MGRIYFCCCSCPFCNRVASYFVFMHFVQSFKKQRLHGVSELIEILFQTENVFPFSPNTAIFYSVTSHKKFSPNFVNKSLIHSSMITISQISNVHQVFYIISLYYSENYQTERPFPNVFLLKVLPIFQ